MTTYRLTIQETPTHLHAAVTGENSAANVAGYLAEVVAACRARGCSRLLIEERLEGPRLATLEVFRVAANGSARATGALAAIAYVDVNAEGHLMKFAETVARNRGLNVGVFATVAEAREWLLKQ